MEFVTVINRKKCKKIYKAIRKPIILFLLYFEIFFALFCCTVLFYPDKDYGMISFMLIPALDSTRMVLYCLCAVDER